MTKISKVLIAVVAMILSAAQSFAGLDWSYGALSNADNVARIPYLAAFSSNGNVFVTGIEGTSSNNIQIVTKKFSSTGILLASVTNSYFVPVGTSILDEVVGIKTDANDNVYILGHQYGSGSRGNDVVLIKYNSSLVQQWKKLIYNTNQPNNFDDKPCKIILDANNNVYVSGTWNNVTITGFMEEIFVQKYSSSGTLLLNTTIPQAAGKTIEDVNDMCIDNSLNITVCARAKDGNNVYSIMYARIDNTGSLVWKKFYSPNYSYTLLSNPEIECVGSGTLYLSTSALKQLSMYNYRVKVSIVKLNQGGIQQWEWLAPEIQEHTLEIKLRLDANQDIYAGSDFGDVTGTGYKDHRIYKVNSSGTLQWTYVANLSSDGFSFETFGSSSLFIKYTDKTTSTYVSKLRKIDAINGNVLWTETMSYVPPAGYHNCMVQITGLAVHPSTSEVITCNYIHAYSDATNQQEYRWMINKYGATSPRLSLNETNNAKHENKIGLQLFPNPANQNVNVKWEGDFDSQTEVRIMDVTGKTVADIKQEQLTESIVQIDIAQLPNGIYTVLLFGKENSAKAKFVVSH